jgi:hypothetical protein
MNKVSMSLEKIYHALSKFNDFTLMEANLNFDTENNNIAEILSRVSASNRRFM